MKKLQLLIVEDMLQERLMLRTNIEKHFSELIDADTICETTSYDEALGKIANGFRFDISILDLWLPGGKTCLDLLNDAWSTEQFGFLIFKTTSTRDLPLLNGFVSLIVNYACLKNGYYPNSLRTAFAEYQAKRNSIVTLPKTIAVGIAKGVINIYQEDVIYIEKIKNTNDCCIHFLINGSLESYQKKNTLSHYEGCLDSEIFLRIHDSYIVNVLPKHRCVYSGISITLGYEKQSQQILLPVSAKYNDVANRRFKV